MVTRNKLLFYVSAVLLIGAMIAVEILFHPRISIQAERQLARTDENAVELLFQRRPLEEIRKAVEDSGKGIDNISWWSGSLLYWAAHKRRIDVAEWLLEAGANPNGIDLGRLPLFVAVVNGDVPMINLLVKSGASPDVGPASGATPRDAARTKGNPDVIAALAPRKTTESPTTETE